MQNWTEAPRAPREIGILLFDRFSNLCLANCIEPLRAANDFAGRRAYNWRFLSCDGAPLHSSSGLPVQPEGPLADLPRGSELFVLASYGHLAHDTARTRRLLRAAAPGLDRIIGFDSAPWLMARAGLLRGRRATLHPDLLASFSEAFLDIEAIEAPLVMDGDRVTCAGAMAAFDFVRGMIRRDLGVGVALDIDALFLSSATPPAGRSTPGDALVARMIALVRAHLEDPLPLTVLADRLGVTPRTLTRRCTSALGTSPGAVARHLRLSAARQMVEGTSQSIAEIAVRCGYEDPAALTRAFRARFGCAPRVLRRQTAPELS